MADLNRIAICVILVYGASLALHTVLQKSLPRRFSLRTLLIATTLIAIGLGLVVATGAVMKTFKPSDLIVRRVAFSRDGKYFLVSRWDGKVRVRDTATTRLRALLGSGSHCADMSDDERFVATSGRGSTAEVFAVDLHDPTAEEQLRIAKLIEQFQNDSYEVRVSAAEELAKIGLVAEPQLRAAMSHEDAETRVRARHLREKVLSPEPIARLPGHRGDVEVVDIAADGRLLASACRGGDIKIWDTAAFTEVVTLNVPTAE